MRLFAAVVPSAEAVADLAAAVQPLRDHPLTWSDTSTWHLTLAFYGEVDESRVPELSERLRRAARRGERMTLRFAGAGRFGSAVLWAGVQGDVEPLRRLAASAVAAGRRMGLDREPGRSYRPHLTLARSARRHDLRPLVSALSGYAGPAWEVTDLLLVRSHLRAAAGGRARHEPIDRFGLGVTP